MKLTVLLPLATLGVVSRPHSILNLIQVSNLDTSLPAWTIDNTYTADDNSSLFSDAPVLLQPAHSVLNIASESAKTISILPLEPPTVNSSYHLQFPGPSFQCEDAADYELEIFDWYKFNFTRETSFYPSVQEYSSFDGSVKVFPDTLLYSAFSLSLLNYTTAEPGSRVDSYNNWIAEVPFETFNTSSKQQI